MRLFKLALGLFFALTIFWPQGLGNAAALSYGGQTQQYYDVIFDKEQEAAVVAKLTYLNRGQAEIKDLSLVIPGNLVRLISVVQEKIETKTSCPNNTTPQAPGAQSGCAEGYGYPTDYLTYTLLDFDASRLIVSNQMTTLNLALKEPIASQKSSTIILYYKVQGLSEKEWNGYSYGFETIKSAYDIDNVRVSVNVADDLYIKDTAKGETNYRESLPQAASFLSSSAFKEDASMDQLSRGIQESPGVVKQTSSLDPNENFRVEGSYYNNSWMGELPTILGVGLTFLLILVILAIIIKNEKKKV